MAKQGGYRRPANPAPVSGPGKLSRRTDGGPTQGAKYMAGSGKYGEGKALMEAQQSAPMSGGTPAPAPVAVPAPQSPLQGLFAPTQRPDEPVTAGVPVGPGESPVPIPAGNYDMINKYMPALETMAAQPDAPETFKAFVNYVKVESQK